MAMSPQFSFAVGGAVVVSTLCCHGTEVSVTCDTAVTVWMSELQHLRGPDIIKIATCWLSFLKVLCRYHASHTATLCLLCSLGSGGKRGQIAG